MIDLTGKHIFVAGGSRGIGAAAAIMAARAGAAVSINYLQNAGAVQQIVTQIEESGGQAVALPGDVAAEGDMDRAIDEAVVRLGPLSGLVVSAGIFEGAHL